MEPAANDRGPWLWLVGLAVAGAHLPAWLFVPLAPIPLGILYFGCFVLVVHEASHDMFVVFRDRQRQKRWNRAFGWAVAVVFATHYGKHWEHGHREHHVRPLEPADPQQHNILVGRPLLVRVLCNLPLECFDDYRDGLNPDALCYIDVAPVKPEKVSAFEVGYRTTLFNSLYVDAGYYYNRYRDFLGFNIGADVELNPANGLIEDLQIYRVSANSDSTVTSQGLSIGLNYYFADYYQLSGNYSWNKLISDVDDPIVPAFNTPEHKFNIGLSGRNITMKLGNLVLRNWGFSINYKWIDEFLFEGSPQFTGIVESYTLLDAQLNYNHKKWHTTFKLGASNLLNSKNFQTYGGPRIGRLAYFSITYDFKKL